jgi:hypothetical protein
LLLTFLLPSFWKRIGYKSRIEEREMTKYKIEVMSMKGWRKLRSSCLFLLRETAEAYGRKYLRGQWRVVEVEVD